MGVHAICAALLGKQRGIKLIDARQMFYGYSPAAEPVVEEQKEQQPKCDICKVTIKRAGTITVKCCGVDQEAVERDHDEAMEDNSDRGEQEQEFNTISCTKHVHSSCLMERSKWKSCVIGQQVRGFCRAHEP